MSNEVVSGWKKWLESNELIVAELMKRGCTRGEALQIISMNDVQRNFAELECGLIELSRALSQLAEAFNHISDDGEGWRGDG